MMSTEQLPFSWDMVQKRPKTEGKTETDFISSTKLLLLPDGLCDKGFKPKPEVRVHTLRPCVTNVTV